VSTKYWTNWGGLNNTPSDPEGESRTEVLNSKSINTQHEFLMTQSELWTGNNPWKKSKLDALKGAFSSVPVTQRCLANMVEISLGGDTKDIARGLFSALRELDRRDVDVIYVEGIRDEGDIAAAVMNRLRKAATVIRK